MPEPLNKFFPGSIEPVDVTPRDGLQNEQTEIGTAAKIELIRRSFEAGFRRIEVAAMVNPERVPRMADGLEVLKAVNHWEGLRTSVLVPNLKGFQRMETEGVLPHEIAFFTAVSETFCQKNTNASVKESLKRFETLKQKADEYGLKTRVYISTVFGCPYEGLIAPEKVAEIVASALDIGCDEIALGDTTGIGTPFATRNLFEILLSNVPARKLAAHFHDTYGQALANLWVALSCGIGTVDVSIGGSGGCPFAKGASGNLAAEDFLYMLGDSKRVAGVDLEATVDCAAFVSKLLKKNLPKVSQAILARRT